VDVPTGDVTRRFAVLNMDWDKLKAVDLLALFNSFKPKDGTILSVAIYPSEFGKARMAEEDRFGPQRAFKSAAPTGATKPQATGKDEEEEDDEEEEEEDEEEEQEQEQEHDDEEDEDEEDEEEGDEDEEDEDEEDEDEEGEDEEDEDEEDEDEEDEEEDEEEEESDSQEASRPAQSAPSKKAAPARNKELVDVGVVPEEGDAANEVDYLQLRKYQIERLRYYYAVVECDSAATAEAIYDQCDGLEYEGSANMLDLRFIPDDISYDNETPREVATQVPPSYRPIRFETKVRKASAAG